MDSSGTRRANTRSGLMLLVFAGIFALAVIGMLSYMIATRPLVGPAHVGNATSLVTVNCVGARLLNATGCSTSNTCQRGLYDAPNDACTYLNAPTGPSNCSTACYPTGSTACTGDGRCIGLPENCIGSCEDGPICTIFLANRNWALYEAFDPVTGWTPASWYDLSGCWYGTCVNTLVDFFVGSSTDAIFKNPQNLTYNFTVLGARSRCEEYVTDAFREQYGECLHFEEHLLANEMISDYNDWGSGGYCNASFPCQLRVCFTSFSCNTFGNPSSSSASASAAAAVVRARVANGTAVYGTAQSFGFNPVAGSPTPATPNGPLNLRDPLLRSLFWSDMRDLIVDALPAYDAELRRRRNQAMHMPAPTPTPVG